MVVVEARNRLELARAFLCEDSGSGEAIKGHLQGCDEWELLSLVEDAKSNEDRLAAALRLIPTNVAVGLACDFAEHALQTGTKDGFMVAYDEENDKNLQNLRRWIVQPGVIPEVDLLIVQWAIYYRPWLQPGIYEAARAVTDPANAGKHCLKAARQARVYYSTRINGFRAHRRKSHDAQRLEQTWQIEHTKTVLVQLAVHSHENDLH